MRATFRNCRAGSLSIISSSRLSSHVKQLFSLCMDNASNCSKAASILGKKLLTFPGDAGRLRCLAHIINLITKVRSQSNYAVFMLLNRTNMLCGQVFLSFFFKQKKMKKVAKSSAASDGGYSMMYMLTPKLF